jgi:hypothetical protein
MTTVRCGMALASVVAGCPKRDEGACGPGRLGTDRQTTKAGVTGQDCHQVAASDDVVPGRVGVSWILAYIGVLLW